jgi:Ca2+:H+ antiporter
MKQTNVLSTLVMLVSFVLVVPTTILLSHASEHPDDPDMETTMLLISHGTAIILLLLFIAYVVFRFRMHSNVFKRGDKAAHRGFTMSSTLSSWAAQSSFEPGPVSLAAFFVAAGACAVINARYLILSVSGLGPSLHLTKSFTGVILLPMVGNLGKSFMIVNRARKKADLTIRIIMSNILDTLLFITPLLVLLGWAMGKPVGLDFGLFETIVFLLAMIISTYLLEHGKTTYFEGFMLVGT